MCGIVYIEKEGNAVKNILKRYRKQRHRGQSGFGFVGARKNVIRYHDRTQSEKEIRKKLERATADIILFHHRFPTSTPNLPETNHPFLIRHKSFVNDYYVVHNGIITNDAELQSKHSKLGYRYTSGVRTQYVTASGYEYNGTTKYNDSESLAWELARFFEGKQKSIDAKGDIAFVALCVSKSGNVRGVYYGKNDGNPLTVTLEKNFFSIASEGGKALEPDTLYYRDAETGATTTRSIPIGETLHKKYAPTYTSTYTPSLGFEKIQDDEEYFDLTAEKTQKQRLLNDAIRNGDEQTAELIRQDLEDIETELAECSTE